MDSLKILGQSMPAANILTTIYTVPALAQATISSVVVCNQGLTPSAFKMSVAINGAIDDPKQYLYYNLFIDQTDTFIATIGISLASGDQIRIESENGSMSFNIFGVEI